nr:MULTISPECIES: sulfur carrier protein ThiS [unclassified Nannocystis]
MSCRRTWRQLVPPPVRCTFPPVPTLVLNGEPHPFTPGTTVAALVASLGLDPRQVAVERNREIVPRATYDQTELVDGDRLEVVTFVGGG